MILRLVMVLSRPEHPLVCSQSQCFLPFTDDSGVRVRGSGKRLNGANGAAWILLVRKKTGVQGMSGGALEAVAVPVRM